MFKTPLTPESLRAGQLYGVLLKAQGEAKPLADSVLAEKIRAAEDLYEHELNIFWRERRVASDAMERVAAGVLTTDAFDVEQPALNYPEDFFVEERWGYTQLAYRPVSAVTRVFYRYPGTSYFNSYNLPADWVRLDRKYGRFYIIPASGAAGLSVATLNAYIMSILGGGRGLPQSFYVDYTAGFAPGALQCDHNDLLEAVRICAALLCFGIASIVRTGGVTSASLAMDGLSRSQSFGNGKFGPYSGTIELALQMEERALKGWRASEHGVPCMFL